jgi:DNA-binding NtrC family response regulator
MSATSFIDPSATVRRPMTTATTKPVLDILLVDDAAEVRADMAEYFSRQGHQVTQCGDGDQALELVERRVFDVLVLDLVMPGRSGLDVLKELSARHAECEVVVLTGEATIEAAVEAMKLGAREFLKKPISLKELDRLVRKAYETGQLRKENRQLKAALRRQQSSPAIIGESPLMQEVFRLVARVGPTDKPILIQGESGTGKELIARALYESSQLSDKPFVTINCAALPETLLESELFGHERGSFTGAIGSKQGLFEVADGGTLFIDEIGELALDLQAKLLRVLEDGSLRRVGSVKERRVKVRLIAATNRDLQQEVKEKRFREDLFYRVNVLTIHLPPLRQRPGDVRLLVEHFVNSEWHVAPDLVPTLERYSWPGNVRQLQNAIDRAKILSDDDHIRIENLPPEVADHASSQPVLAGAGDVDLDTLTKHHILDTYERHGGNKARTARALGIGRRTLYRLLERYKPGEVDDP